MCIPFLIFLFLFSSSIFAGEFPCNLESHLHSKKSLPPIILSGEDHDCDLCKEDRDYRISKAGKKNGKYWIGLEGFFYEIPYLDPWTFGIEDKLVHTLSGFIRAYQDLTLIPLSSCVNQSRLEKILMELMTEFMHVNIYQEIWITVRPHLLANFPFNTVTPLFDNLIQGKQNSDQEILTKLYKPHLTLAGFTAFRRDLMQVLFEMAQRTSQEVSTIAPNLTLLMNQVTQLQDLSPHELDTLEDQITIELRNEIMGTAIGLKYCEILNTNDSRGIFAVVGLDHLDHLEKVLKRKTDNLVNIRLKNAQESTLKRQAKKSQQDKRKSKKSRPNLSEEPLPFSPISLPLFETPDLPPLLFDSEFGTYVE